MVMNRLLAGMNIQVVSSVAAGHLVVLFVFEKALLFSFYVDTLCGFLSHQVLTAVDVMWMFLGCGCCSGSSCVMSF